MTLNRNVRCSADRRNLLFSWAYSAQTVCPPPKITHKRHILGMLTSPRNDSHCQKLCHLSCSLITNTPSEVPILPVFGACKIPGTEIRKFFTGLRMHTPIHVFHFKSSQNWCRISGRKSTFYWWHKTKHILASLGATLGQFPLNFFVWLCTVTSHLYSRFHRDWFSFGEI